MQFKTPKVFPIAETKLNKGHLQAFLTELGVPEWDTRASSDSEVLTEVGGKLCYLSFSEDLNKNLTKVGARGNFDYIQEGIIKNKHGSVLEHSSVTFIVLNVSRVVTHEIVRHRAGAAYSQQSGRYVRTDSLTMADMPSVISDNPSAKEIYEAAVVMQEEAMRMLSACFNLDNTKDFHLKKKVTSAIRRIVGNGQANHIMITANHRAWRHMIEMRTNAGAEEEIRIVFNQIFSYLYENFPALYADAIAEQVDGQPQITFKYSKV